MPDRIRSKSDSVFANVDTIHDAIRLRRKVEFVYYKRGLDGERHATREGRPHVVTPVGVTYAEGYYYLTAWDDDHGNMVEYRLDRMGKARVSDSGATRNAQIDHRVYDEGKYEHFGRFGGDEVTASLDVRADKVEIVMDRFGEAAQLSKLDDETARAYVKICKSEQFFGWVAGMGNTVKIAGPKSLVEEYKSYLCSLIDD